MNNSGMEQTQNPYQSFGMLAADASTDARADFIRKTYLHLAGAVLAFIVVEAALLQTAMAEMMVQWIGTGRWNWLIVLGAFMGVSWLARSWAESAVSPGMQYAGLSLYVVGQAVIFLPLLYMASDPRFGGENVIPIAGGITVLLFGGLTATVFISGADFSFMRGILAIGGLAAMGLIVCSIIFGFNLGLVFTVAMILLMCGYILYDTSNVMHHYHIGQHVAASLALFASVAMLFWYVIRLVMILNRR
jgi:FtsH-binding integral membrane protein